MFENYMSKISFKFPGDQWVKTLVCRTQIISRISRISWPHEPLVHHQPWYWLLRWVPWGKIWPACAISVWSNDIKTQYIFASESIHHIKDKWDVTNNLVSRTIRYDKTFWTDEINKSSPEVSQNIAESQSINPSPKHWPRTMAAPQYKTDMLLCMQLAMCLLAIPGIWVLVRKQYWISIPITCIPWWITG